MKKLLVLMLVLGMASVANATLLTWSVDGVTIPSISATIVVTLNADDAANYSPKWVGLTPASPAIVSIASITAAGSPVRAGPDHQIKTPTDTTYPGWWTVMALDNDVTNPPGQESGIHWYVTLKGLTTGTFALHSDYYNTTDMLEVTVIPEPMTVALLGLGGLFLLRRRK